MLRSLKLKTLRRKGINSVTVFLCLYVNVVLTIIITVGRI